MSYKISVIMPSLNVEGYIDECIRSVINQSYTNLEIICIDAGSTDKTVEILEGYAYNDSRICILHSDIRSYGYQMNMGLQYATGEYIGIVETDDFLAADMYEKLITKADLFDLDYVKSDFKGFVTLGSGHKLYMDNKMSADKQYYNEIIQPYKYPDIYLRDFNIWKGIYKKKFLTDNKIVFNETKGAAFQDIGFVLQTITCAERAMYIDDFGYQYRLDRGESSSNNPNGLKYAYNEFVRLADEVIVCNDVMRERAAGIYYRMCAAYVGEFNKWVRACGYKRDLEEVAGICKWFEEKICWAMNQDVISTEQMGDLGGELMLLLSDSERYTENIEKKDKEKALYEENIIKKAGENGVVIFGSGIYGCRILELLDRKLIGVNVFCDNNEIKQGSFVSGIEVVSVSKAVELYPNACYIVANKKHFEDMAKQLKKCGIAQEKIIIADCPARM